MRRNAALREQVAMGFRSGAATESQLMAWLMNKHGFTEQMAHDFVTEAVHPEWFKRR